MIFQKNKMPERDHILSSGEKIRIRQLAPAERLYFLSLPGKNGLCKRLKAGLIRPKISLWKAKKILNETPFRALEIVRAIQIFSKEYDIIKRNEYIQIQDEKFLKALQSVESFKRRE